MTRHGSSNARTESVLSARKGVRRLLGRLPRPARRLPIRLPGIARYRRGLAERLSNYVAHLAERREAHWLPFPPAHRLFILHFDLQPSFRQDNWDQDYSDTTDPQLTIA
jgi:hypothetical protein